MNRKTLEGTLIVDGISGHVQFVKLGLDCRKMENLKLRAWFADSVVPLRRVIFRYILTLHVFSSAFVFVVVISIFWILILFLYYLFFCWSYFTFCSFCCSVQGYHYFFLIILVCFETDGLNYTVTLRFDCNSCQNDPHFYMSLHLFSPLPKHVRHKKLTAHCHFHVSQVLIFQIFLRWNKIV